MSTSPAEVAFRADIQGGRFLRGVAAVKWRLISTAWPHALIAVSAAPRDRSPVEYALRFELSRYPTALTAGLWDVECNALLPAERRPAGGPNVTIAFRTDWEGGRALYLPCDSVALASHSNWSTKYAARAWRAGLDITYYLNTVYELLNSESYTGSRCAAAEAS